MAIYSAGWWSDPWQAWDAFPPVRAAPLRRPEIQDVAQVLPRGGGGRDVFTTLVRDWAPTPASKYRVIVTPAVLPVLH